MTDCTTDTGCPKPDVNRQLSTIDAELEKINADFDDLEKTIARHHDVANAGRSRVDAELEKIKADLGRLETKIDENTSATSEILEIVQVLKGFVRVVRGAGKIIAWVLGIAAPAVGIWVALGGKK